MTAAIILAAGAGTRLGGVAKAALRLPDGRTFLEAVAGAARAGGCATVVCVARPGDGVTAALARAHGAALVDNPAPERGMASSIAAGLAAVAGHDVALVWPVDHPRVAAATVAAILAASGPDRIVVPCLDGRGGHPTAFGAAVWPELLAAVSAAGGARSVVAADRGRVVRLAVNDPGVLVDVDTPADLIER